MSHNHSGPPQGPNGQKPANPAVLKGMMDDIGLSRLEELPMEDGERRGRNDRGHPANHRVAAGSSQNVSRTQPQMNSMWTIARELGLFDDEDAAQVRGLDDLGGGRSYDREQVYTRVRDQALHILNSMPYGAPPQRGPAGRRGHRGGSTHHTHPAPAPRPPPAPATASQAPMKIQFSLVQRVVLPNPEPTYIYKAMVEISAGLNRPATMVHVYLQEEAGPALGWFLAYKTEDGTKIAEHEIYRLYHCSSSRENGAEQAVLTFNRREGAFASYMLQFPKAAVLGAFLKALHRLQHPTPPTAPPVMPPTPAVSLRLSQPPTDTSGQNIPRQPTTATRKQNRLNINKPTLPPSPADEPPPAESNPTGARGETESGALNDIELLSSEARRYSNDTHRELERVFEAAARGCGPEAREAVKDAIAICYTKTDPNASRESVKRLVDRFFEDTSQKKRIQYTRAQLFDRRDFAVQPPPYLAELRFLPQIGEGKIREATARPFVPAAADTQVRAAVAGMSWALRDTPPPTSPQHSQTSVAKVKTEREPRLIEEGDASENPTGPVTKVGSGLQGSMWAATNGTYLNDLAQLESNDAPVLCRASHQSPTLSIFPIVTSTRTEETNRSHAQGTLAAATTAASRQVRMIQRALASKARQAVADGLDGVSEYMSRLSISGQFEKPAAEKPATEKPVVNNAGHDVTDDEISPPIPARRIVTTPAPTNQITPQKIGTSSHAPKPRPKGLAASRHAF